MITKPKYNIEIILLIINSYLTCEIILIHPNILFYYQCLCFVKLFLFYKKIQCCKILRTLFSNVNCNFIIFNLIFPNTFKLHQSLNVYFACIHSI